MTNAHPSRPPSSARPHRIGAARFVYAAALCAGCATVLAAGCAATLPPPSAARVDTQERERAFANALSRLGAAADEVTVRPSEGGGLEVLGPAPAGSALGSGLFATHVAPKPTEIDATFGQYCRPRGAPERTTHDGFTRLTYRGNERRSGAECTLVADLPRTGRWRFVLRIQRNVNPS